MKVRDSNYIIIISACIITYAIYLISAYIITNGNLGFPLDDAWIHLQFADNFSNGYFFQFNPGEPTAGTTSPLWVILLGTINFIFSSPVFSSLFLSAGFHLLSCIFIYKISLFIFSSDEFPIKNLYSRSELSPRFLALIIALLTVLAGRFAWSSLSGMETTLFTFLSLLGIFIYLKNLSENKLTLIPFLIFALAAAARPEGFLLFGLFIFDSVLNRIRNKKFKSSLPVFIKGILIFSSIAVPYLIFSYVTSGHFFPNTFRGQGGGFNLIPNREYLEVSIKLFMEDNFITGIIFIFLLIFYLLNIKKYFSEFKNVNLIYLWILLLPLISSLIAPNWRHHGRYLIPLIPLIAFGSVYFLIYIFSGIKRTYLRKLVLNKITISLLLIFSVTYYSIFAVSLGLNTDNINNQQIALAKWVKKNVPQEESIALNDIGAITYMTKNHIVDMAGLVTPEFLRYRSYNWNDNLDSMFYLLKKNNVSYIIIYDHWFKEFLDKYGHCLDYIYSAILENNTICGGEEMKVYKTNFYRED